MAPMTPWTDCHKLILANQNLWQNIIFIISSHPRIPNKEKLKLKNMNAKVAEYFLNHSQVEPENCICTYSVYAIIHTYIM